MADTLDLELRLGLGPRDAAPMSNGAAAAEVARADLQVSSGARKSTGGGDTTSQHHVAQAMRAVSDRDETEQPKIAAKVMLQLPQLVEAAEEEEAAAAAEPGSKRVKTEAPPDNLDPPAVHQVIGGGATEPAWVRAELLPRHALPGDLPLHFVQEKVLTQSDLKSNQSRLFIVSSGSERLRHFLSDGELRHCGLDGTSRRRDSARFSQDQQDGAKKKREDKKSHPGVPVLVYERGAEREAAALRLNSFWSTRAVVINGNGFARFVAGSGFEKGDHVEFWAFRRPQDQHLCFVIAKWDGHRRAAINGQE